MSPEYCKLFAYKKAYKEGSRAPQDPPWLRLCIHLLYFEAVLHSMYDVSNNSARKDISEKFVKISSIHSYNTRAASCGKYHIQFSRLNQQQNSFSCFGAKVWNCLPSQVCNLPKLAFKKSIRKALFAALESEEDYIEAPNLLSKINLHFTELFVTNHCLSLRLFSLFGLFKLLPFTNQ